MVLVHLISADEFSLVHWQGKWACTQGKIGNKCVKTFEAESTTRWAVVWGICFSISRSRSLKLCVCVCVFDINFHCKYKIFRVLKTMNIISSFQAFYVLHKGSECRDSESKFSLAAYQVPCLYLAWQSFVLQICEAFLNTFKNIVCILVLSSLCGR